jgi:hypothetical protein
VVEVEIDDGCRVEGQQLADEQPADDRNPERAAQFGTLSEADRERHRQAVKSGGFPGVDSKERERDGFDLSLCSFFRRAKLYCSFRLDFEVENEVENPHR